MAEGQALIDEVNAWCGPAHSMAFWWLGQSSVIVKLSGATIYIDPYLSPDPRRLTPPLLEPMEVTNADIVLCTHDHGDHLDPGAISGIAGASPQAKFVVPVPSRTRVLELGVAEDRVIGLNADESYDFGQVKMTAIKSKHEFFDRTPDGFYPYLGYVLQAAGVCAYIAGDTVNYEGLLTRLQAFPLNVIFLPINGRDATRYLANCIGNLTYQEAVDLAGELCPRLAVPLHYDMFAANSEDPQKFVDYLEAKYPEVRSWVGPHGQRVEVKGTSIV